jgi:Zn-finger nucleic acid-binding protein
MTPVCPKCDVALLILRFHGTELDYCDQCRGLWLDAGEIQEILARTGTGPHDPVLAFLEEGGRIPQGRPCLCPRCDQPMAQITVPSSAIEMLTLERCLRGHGLWFDADELQRLLSLFAPDSGAGKTIALIHDFFSTNPTNQPT